MEEKENENETEDGGRATTKKNRMTARAIIRLCIVVLLGATAFVRNLTALVRLAHEIGVL